MKSKYAANKLLNFSDQWRSMEKYQEKNTMVIAKNNLHIHLKKKGTICTSVNKCCSSYNIIYMKVQPMPI